tara:strand:+ start:378 stop:1526 length:1149 start_codon:yes stop_codon:yes gene_type:complete
MKVDQLIRQAKILLGENKLKDAQILFQNIIKVEPANYKAHTNIGAILLKLGDLDKAKKSFSKAIELNPEFEIAHFNLGIVEAKLLKFNEAEKSYKKAIKLKKDYAEAYSNLGSIYLKLEKLNEAEENFKETIKFKPKFAIGHYNLACTQEKLNKFNEAEKSYKKAIELKENYTEALNNLNRMIKQNKLLSDLREVRKKKISNQVNKVGLSSNPFISKRKVEKELITEIYKINSIEIDNTKDIRFGNGKFSDYELFENDSIILNKVEKDLTQIISQTIKSDIFIIDSFFNILRTGSGLASHHHINNFDRKHNLGNQKYSLTYYLTVGDQNCNEPGILKLYDPNEEILPSEGTIVIFPANRLHSASYGGKTDRVMIGVNFYSLI